MDFNRDVLPTFYNLKVTIYFNKRIFSEIAHGLEMFDFLT